MSSTAPNPAPGPHVAVVRQSRRQRLTLTFTSFTSGLSLAQAAHGSKLWIILAAVSAVNAVDQLRRLRRGDVRQRSSASPGDQPISS
ncbi:hypothetical protein ACFV9C_42295 [Kribbella sp. NPDC059898]|uniref:hypothetical protein n=1 Tax=Kribbella sp. NPDC059898 TaxID=3346995 RepID=UPI0036642ACD